MIILGINGGFRAGYQDVSACLVEDGKVIAAVEEERLNRIKFSPGRLPYLSVLEVLKIAGYKIQDVDFLAFHGSTWGSEIEQKVVGYFTFHFGYAPPLKRFHHHDCHAASAYYASGFEDALVVTFDNSGDGISTQIAIGENGKLKLIERFDRNNSLGFYYSLINQFCGFVKDSDEYKLMGLSSYGNREKFDFSWLIHFSEGALELNKSFIQTVEPRAPALHRDEMNFNSAFARRMGVSRRLPGTPFSDIYKDIAACAQQHLEDTVLNMLKYYVSQTGKSKVCLAGGVALNCVMNQRIMNAEFCEDLFVQPASSDAGISLGAAWLASDEEGIAPIKTETTFLGNSFKDSEIKQTLDDCGISYTETDNPAGMASEFISKNKVIGWFQSRMEFGPRALGSRSILANPTSGNMQEIVNKKIKLRESFRPFCPSVLQTDTKKYFDGKSGDAPYMTITFDVKEKMRNVIPGVTHVDGTARIQTVTAQQNPIYHELLETLKTSTGHGVVLNTSFNLSHEPIVNSPRNALATFYSSGLDALVIGSFVVKKKG